MRVVQLYVAYYGGEFLNVKCEDYASLDEAKALFKNSAKGRIRLMFVRDHDGNFWDWRHKPRVKRGAKPR